MMPPIHTTKLGEVGIFIKMYKIYKKGFVFTIFLSRGPIKARAVIASDYKKKRLMIPIYNSRLSNDTAES